MAGTENDAPNSEQKERLLQAATDYVAEHGVADLSLRGLAAAIGTSHRMLIYHFGSKEDLLIAVIRAVEEQQRQLLSSFRVDPSLPPAELLGRMWQHISNPKLHRNERLFFEMYGQALQGRPHTVEFLDGIVESWLEPIATLREQQGVPPRVARAQARLDLAITRGLLLDLLATGDRTGVNEAMAQFGALYDAWSATVSGNATRRS